jgi:hypothetical protein
MDAGIDEASNYCRVTRNRLILILTGPREILMRRAGTFQPLHVGLVDVGGKARLGGGGHERSFGAIRYLPVPLKTIFRRLLILFLELTPLASISISTLCCPG